MRAIMTDALYNQMARQLQTLIDAKQTNYVERIAVLERIATDPAARTAREIEALR